MVQDSHSLFPRVRDPQGGTPCSSGEGSSPRGFEPIKKDSTSIIVGFPASGVIMPVMCVEREEPLGPESRGVESGTRKPSC
jgi:hypothetical protein